MVEIDYTNEFEVWYLDLDDADTKAVTRVVDMLETAGVTLGHPYSSEIKGSRYALRELRIQSCGKPLRVLYAFDPERQAVLILGGDKTGVSDKRFYGEFIPRAEGLWEENLRKNKERKPT